MKGIIFIIMCIIAAYTVSYNIPNMMDARNLKMMVKG